MRVQPLAHLAAEALLLVGVGDFEVHGYPSLLTAGTPSSSALPPPPRDAASASQIGGSVAPCGPWRGSAATADFSWWERSCDVSVFDKARNGGGTHARDAGPRRVRLPRARE